MTKIQIDPIILEQLNKSIADRIEAFQVINKFNTAEPLVDEVKPKKIVGDEFDAKNWCGEPGADDETTIAGCINNIGKEMCEFVEGIEWVDAQDEEKEEKTERRTGSKYYGDYTPPADTPVDDTPVEETPVEETPAEETPVEETPAEEEEIVVVPVTPPLDDILEQFETGDDNKPSEKTSLGTITVNQDNVIITDENSNFLGNADQTSYTVYEVIEDGEGNALTVRITPDGTEPEQWIQVNQNGESVGYYYEQDQVGVFDCKKSGIQILDKDGNVIDTLNTGKYKVYGVKVDNDGNITEVRISKPGEEEKWLKISENGKYIDDSEGIYTTKGIQVTNSKEQDNGNNTKIKTAAGGNRNKILGGVLGVLVVGLGATIYVKKKQDGKTSTDNEPLPEGEYNVYDYKSDEEGNITSAKISEDGAAEEQWVEF